MTDPLPHDVQLRRLQEWRNRRDRDLSLSFMRGLFKQEVEKPHKQLQALVALWQQHVPPDLCRRTRLDSLARGVLKVSVDSSSTLYELDRLLREGLERTLIVDNKGPALRRVQLRVAVLEEPEQSSATPTPRSQVATDEEE